MLISRTHSGERDNYSMELTLLIPTYNEADLIESTLTAIARELGSELAARTEVLVVDDGKDHLPEVVERAAPALGFGRLKTLRNSPPLGKGRSLALGFLQATAPIAGFLDADLSTPPSYIKLAVERIRSGQIDIFIGSRRAKESRVTREQSAIKTVLGDILSTQINAFLFSGGRRYLDTQCGFKFFKAEVAKRLYSDLVAFDGMTDIEVLIRANLLGYRVEEHGVVWQDLRESKRSLRRILVGELRAISSIVYHYKLFGARQRRKLREPA